MTQFLTKSPDVAIVEIKEKLYERLETLRVCVYDPPLDERDDCYKNEIEFLSGLLDLIERS